VSRRPLTPGERALVRDIFGDAIDCEQVTIRRSRFHPLHPRHFLMAPMGHIHAHPRSNLWSEDYSGESLGLQALFLHEMTHVWQAQKRGRFYLLLMRHPFCRYRYRFEPGKPFDRYGLEQQAEIVRHVFLLRHGVVVSGAPPLEQLEAILPRGSFASLT
jgi:hypothetical protein